MSTNARTRFYEILPGALVWATLIGAVLFSYLYPLAVICFIIVFDIYWMLRIAYYLPFLLSSWYRYRRALGRDWHAAAQAMPGYGEITHLVMLPTWKESVDVIRGTMENMLACATSADRIIVCLGGEERDEKHFWENADIIRREYNGRFKHLFITMHPDPRKREGEIQGKGSNLHWMAEQIKPVIEQMGIAPEKLIVHSFDVDTVAHPQYFEAVTYAYLSEKDPTKCSYQPVALYNNNLWDATAPVRVAMFGTTFWLMTELARPEHMMTFSSHSMSWRMLLDVGFWQKDIVSEDSRIFLQGLVRYHGQYHVVPIYLPVSMDSIADSYIGSIKQLYLQMRRWAWGVENYPYMANAFRVDRQMPLGVKWIYTFKQLEGMYTWATAPLLITILGKLPFWLAPEAYRSFALFQNTPFTLERLMQYSLVGAFVSAGLALTLLPPRPAHVPRRNAIAVWLLQWLLLPVTFIVFGSIPAIDAQTRQMLGGRFRLGFNVTAKKRKVPLPVVS